MGRCIEAKSLYILGYCDPYMELLETRFQICRICTSVFFPDILNIGFCWISYESYRDPSGRFQNRNFQ
jgi:hypothetical protein